MHPLVLLLGVLRLLTGDVLPGGTTGLTALAAAATLMVLAGVATTTFVLTRLLGARAPHAVRDGTLRRQALRTAFLPQRDPDARGRRRPRAPGAALAAAQALV
ncbi:DUF6412 domain-containing protein [Kitasatospora sp. GAS204B]|uniref:DUF6412 domain-containing protein n=1 Tax=unclassified Kitasatospora TaxID=2633591 RepID=UPI0024748050|nr:DUF6412 domain-containing protein [Kitasatospora sp. GAS204B]MDH6121552.1 hypothetical protein [Kitasatospora sp. GAS204B]